MPPHRVAHVVVFDAHSPGAEAELDAGGPHNDVAHRVNQDPLPRPLVESQKLAHARHSICRAHKVFLERSFKFQASHSMPNFSGISCTPLALHNAQQ